MNRRADLLSGAYRLPVIVQAWRAAEMIRSMLPNTPGAGFLAKVYANAQVRVGMKAGLMVRRQIAPPSKQTA
jgi:hypothetical protein